MPDEPEIRIDIPKEPGASPALVLRIPLPWPRLLKLWGRLGPHLRHIDTKEPSHERTPPDSR